MTADTHLVPDWPAPPGVRALCTLRAAGSFGVDEEAGRAVRAHRLGLPSTPAWLRQVHGIAVADLDRTLAVGEVPVADAAVASRAGVVCAVLSADCLPVLLAAADGSVVGAAHAGWRGLAAGVIEATVAALRARAGGRGPLLAWLGPAISAAHFEVGDEVREAFLAVDPAATQAFSANARGRWQCDLYQLARQRLARLGVAQVSGGQYCTWTGAGQFFSHRREVAARPGASTGRMATLIWRGDA